jgi:Fic family protein
MAYQRILPFPSIDTLSSAELQALASVWQEKKGQLENDGAYKEFIKKMEREWAIETGIIERLYTWDRGVTEVLIEQGIEASIISHRGGVSQIHAEHIQAVINDHLNIVDGLFGYIKGEEPLTEHFIRGLQAQFTAHQDTTEAITESGSVINVRLIKGEYKHLPNNPRRADGQMHSYCPPELTKDEMERLIDTYRNEEASYPPEVKAAWLHHRFTQIHPFQDGNGRVARSLATLVFLREGLFPLVIRESDREEYILALEAADAEDLSKLVALFVRRQRDAILKALGLEQQVQQSKYADQIISSALQLLKSRFHREKQKVSIVYEHAENLFKFVDAKFKEVVGGLDGQLRQLTPPNAKAKYQARTNAANNDAPNRHYFQKQIVDIANHFDYFANLDPHRSWVRMTLTTEREFDLVISIHGYGSAESGVLAASAFSFLKVPTEDGRNETVNLHPAAADLFQFNYAEPFDSIQKRFAEWYESSLAIGLAEWQRSLQM